MEIVRQSRQEKRILSTRDKKKTRRNENKRGKTMQDNDRKNENERTSKKMKNRRKWKRKWTKMNEHERKWKKMKENGVLFKMFIIPYGITGAARAAPLFTQARSKLFQNVHYSLGIKESRPEEHPQGDLERPASDLSGRVFWRREISIYRTEIERRRDETRRNEKKIMCLEKSAFHIAKIRNILRFPVKNVANCETLFLFFFCKFL